MLYKSSLKAKSALNQLTTTFMRVFFSALILTSCAQLKKTDSQGALSSDTNETQKNLSNETKNGASNGLAEAETDVSDNAASESGPDDSELILIRPSTPSNAKGSAQTSSNEALSEQETGPGDDNGYGQDALARMRSKLGTQIDLKTDHPQVRAQLEWYAKNQEFLDRSFNRSARYLHHVIGEVEKRNMPMELALLPFVESAYNPFAYSSGRASGLWQFISGTGRIYGLQQNWWYDGRRDVLASTQAALDYLEYLNKLFDGNWLHAVAAYNSGSGRVTREIAKNKKKKLPTDFWSLQLPKETRSYVPYLLAISKLVQDPARHGVKLPTIPDKPYFAVVKTDAQIDLSQAASLAEIDIEEMYQLNPGFNQWATDPLGPHRLLVPVENAEIFAAKLKALPTDNRVSWNRYTVKRGDTLGKIARNFHTTPDLIQGMNQLKNGPLKEKQTLLIPMTTKDKGLHDAGSESILTGQNRILNPQDITRIDHVVKSGDTIWELARKHKVAVRDIARWNKLKPNTPLTDGQTLLIWSKLNIGAARPLVSNPASKLGSDRQMIRRIGYQVKKGDTLSQIAKKFGVSVNNLATWNKLNKKKHLKPGQKLTILVDVKNG